MSQVDGHDGLSRERRRSGVEQRPGLVARVRRGIPDGWPRRGLHRSRGRRGT